MISSLRLFISILLSIWRVSCVSAESDTSWCRADLKCNCTLNPGSLEWTCHDVNQTIAVRVIPSQANDPTWHIECVKGLASQITSAHLSLGNVSALSMQNCGTSSGRDRLVDIFKESNISGLHGLKIDLYKGGKLSKASFEGLQEEYPQLQTLALVRISKADEDILSPLSQLSKLTIEKSAPILTSRFLQGLTSLEHLEIFQDRGSNNLPEEIFDSCENLKVLNLSSYGLTSITSKIFSKLVNLEELVLNKNYIKTVPEDLFASNLKLKTLSWLEDYCSKDENCTRIFPENLFKSNQELQTFKYSWRFNGNGGKINSVSFLCHLPSSIQTLVIQDTQKLTWSEIKPLLANLNHLKNLDLRKNKIEFLDQYLSDFPVLEQLEILNLTDNLVDCNQCKVLSRKNTILDKCFHNGKDELELHNSSSLARVLSIYCNNDQLTILITACTLGGIIAILVIFIVATFISERLRVKLYNNNFFAKFFPAEADNMDKDFDVFVSYAQEDAEFAAVIVGRLEGSLGSGGGDADRDVIAKSSIKGRTFRCCVHERDWTVGNPITQNIFDSVNRSKRTLIILSQAFLKSTYCLQEFNEAFTNSPGLRLLVVMRVHPETNEVVVSSKDFDNDQQFSAVKNYVQTYTYLREDDRDFWQKLVYRLPHKKMATSGRTSPERTSGNVPKHRRASEIRRLISNISNFDEKSELPVLPVTTSVHRTY